MSLFSNFPQSPDAGIKEEIAALENRVQPVDKGGTGRSALDAGCVLVGNGTEPVEMRGIRDNTSVSDGIPEETTLVTSKTLRYALNRTNGVGGSNSDYDSYMARGMALSSSELTPHYNGQIAWQYE